MIEIQGMPRFQGRVGEIEDPPELKGQWMFEIFISIIGDGQEKRRVFEHGPHPTRDAAMTELRKAITLCVKSAQEKLGVPVTGDCIDLQSNRKRNLEDEA